MTLTLPIVVGKKYVRRDGKVITARHGEQSASWLAIVEGVGVSSSRSVYLDTGCVWALSQPADFDLVADYIEPAKGHPHAALMLEFARDAQESETPWDQWQDSVMVRDGEFTPWADVYEAPRWFANRRYRRKPTITPDPHAESAAEYAKDMAVSDKAWQGWEMSFSDCSQDLWTDCRMHPGWSRSIKYRRKGSL